LLGDDGTAYDVISIEEARKIAQEQGLDLVEVSPNAKPPVVKLIDYGKFKYDQQKKANEAKKKQSQAQLKEIQVRPNIEAHDLETKLKKVYRFLEDADKVKMVMQFRGREMAYRDSGLEKFKEILEGICSYGAVLESPPKIMGNRIISILSPDKKELDKRSKERKRLEKLEAKEREAENAGNEEQNAENEEQSTAE
jgi:translation initiation factor IF-3